MKSRSGKKRSNNGILKVIYGVSLLFFVMIGYLIYFIGFQAEDLMGNSYNARMDVFSDRFVRGSILSSDGVVLAQTQVAEDGTETRVYPYGDMFAHVVGYSTRGKTGLEALANFYLLKSHVNLAEQVANELMDVKNIGDNAVTTLDFQLQQLAYEALGDKSGAVIAMDPKTGKVLCMVSKPGFDPNTLAEEWDSLTSSENKSGQLVNRATQGLYPPGSTFKMITVLEYLHEHNGDVSDFSYTCTGEYVDPEDPSYVIHCYGNEAHGTQTLEEAFANSCNAAFAQLGLSLDRTRLGTLAEGLLFNESLPISIASSASRFSVTEETDTWTMMQSSIGQGEILMSPLHNLLLASAVANDGVLAEPLLLERLESAEGETVRSFQLKDTVQLMSESDAQFLKGYMRKVVEQGTASALRTDAYAACGKTGSAEYTENGEKKTHAWFTGFAPMEDPEIAVCVLVEDGRTGGSTAAPIARQIFDYWLSR